MFFDVSNVSPNCTQLTTLVDESSSLNTDRLKTQYLGQTSPTHRPPSIGCQTSCSEASYRRQSQISSSKNNTERAHTGARTLQNPNPHDMTTTSITARRMFELTDRSDPNHSGLPVESLAPHHPREDQLGPWPTSVTRSTRAPRLGWPKCCRFRGCAASVFVELVVIIIKMGEQSAPWSPRIANTFMFYFFKCICYCPLMCRPECGVVQEVNVSSAISSS